MVGLAVVGRIFWSGRCRRGTRSASSAGTSSGLSDVADVAYPAVGRKKSQRKREQRRGIRYSRPPKTTSIAAAARLLGSRQATACRAPRRPDMYLRHAPPFLPDGQFVATLGPLPSCPRDGTLHTSAEDAFRASQWRRLLTRDLRPQSGYQNFRRTLRSLHGFLPYEIVSVSGRAATDKFTRSCTALGEFFLLKVSKRKGWSQE